ncbi:MAG: VWA domain-containing protein, partial [Venatoribacter sp.]
GSGHRHALAWRDADSLHLPAQLDFYPSQELNQDLYLWLTALASSSNLVAMHRGNWIVENQAAVLTCLERFPGLHATYEKLAKAEVHERTVRLTISKANQTREASIHKALLNPGSVEFLPKGQGDADPVPLWLYPGDKRVVGKREDDEEQDSREANKDKPKQLKKNQRKKAEYTDDQDSRTGLMLFRLESLFSWSEFIPLDRNEDDSDDEDTERVAEDLDKITLSKTRSTKASKIKLDLDLPSEIEDDIPLTEGLLYPEWDYRKRMLKKDHCRVIPFSPRKAEPSPIPAKLLPMANKLRKQFSSFNTQPLVLRRQLQGHELDINACLEYRVAMQHGTASSAAAVWKQKQVQHRDLSCLVLADLSLSTDAWVNGDKQVIDVIRESLHLMGEALNASDDDFALYGFSSRKRNHVRFNMIKNYNEPWSDIIHGRIAALEPGYYTRLGAAIRQSIDIIQDHPADKRLLLILTDGKPNDLDIYEGRYGIEDTRKAILEAHQAGIITYCVTIDQSTADYVPYVFGQQRYYHLNKAEQLPTMLPRLYLNLTGRIQ